MASKGNKVALVTGSTSGIGLATAKVLAKEGCNLIITGFASQEEINTIKNDIAKEANVKVDYVACDLRNVAEIKNMSTEIFQLYPDGIDILVNNAGFMHVSRIEDFPDDVWDDMLAVMLSAPFHLTKIFLPGMKKQGWGRIVNISSMMCFMALPDKTPYAAAKTGLVGLTRGVALEAAEYGVTCNAVCPTFALTNVVEAQLKKKMELNGTTFEQEKEVITNQIPVRQFTTPEQIADYIKYLCFSIASPMMTGSTYLMDGGYTAK